MAVASSLPPFASSVYFEDDDAILTLGTAKLEELAAIWRRLGLQLRVPVKTLDEIDAVAGKDSVVDKFEKMLQYWIRNGKEERQTWGFLAGAVGKAGNNALAGLIRRRKDYRQDVKVPLQVGKLLEMLREMTAKWKRLAGQLFIPLDVQETIDNPLTVNECLMKMLTAWVKDSGKATFQVLIEALESHAVGFRNLAFDTVKDVEVLKLLKVPVDAKDKRIIQKQLDDYISQLEQATLPDPPVHPPGERVPNGSQTTCGMSREQVSPIQVANGHS